MDWFTVSVLLIILGLILHLKVSEEVERGYKPRVMRYIDVGVIVLIVVLLLLRVLLASMA